MIILNQNILRKQINVYKDFANGIEEKFGALNCEAGKHLSTGIN